MIPKLKLDENGFEVPDSRPVSIPPGFKEPETMQQMIARLCRTTLSQMAQLNEDDTFEESEDFEVDDDMFDPKSPYEEVFDPVLGRGITLEEFRQNQAVYEQRFLEAERKAFLAMDRSQALRARPKKSGDGAEPRVSSEPAPPAPDSKAAPAK